MKRATGIGGVFFRAKDPAALSAWYGAHLGVPFEGDMGGVFRWRESDGADAMTIWSPFENDTTYFGDAAQQVMINYRVADMDGLLEALRAEGVTIADRKDEPYGKFAWIVDPEGNRVELWEPPKAG
jgi:predicted enzyme related to lactoylglutathione lyase